MPGGANQQPNSNGTVATPANTNEVPTFDQNVGTTVPNITQPTVDVKQQMPQQQMPQQQMPQQQMPQQQMPQQQMPQQQMQQPQQQMPQQQMQMQQPLQQPLQMQQPQQNFNPQSNVGFQQNSNGQQQESNPHNNYIIDMFWFVNKKLYANQSLEQNEAGLLTIGFNASFNNLRIGLYQLNGDSTTNSSIIIMNCTKLANFNIFPEHALQINSTEGQTNIFERVIRGGWQPNESVITKTNDIIKFESSYNNTTFHYTLLDEQIIGFNKAMEFLTNGQSWLAGILGVINR